MVKALKKYILFETVSSQYTNNLNVDGWRGPWVCNESHIISEPLLQIMHLHSSILSHYDIP
jgi:hypothetical protein